MAASAPVTRAAPLAGFVVDVSQLQVGLDRSLVDERSEQIADWAVAGSLVQLVREQPEALPALGRLPAFGAMVVQEPNGAATGGRVGSWKTPWKCKGFCLSARRDSDPRPSAWEADALPTELLAHSFVFVKA